MRESRERFTGRRIVVLDVGGHAGEQSREIARGRRLEAGVYLLRLSQGTRSATSRVTISR